MVLLFHFTKVEDLKTSPTNLKFHKFYSGAPFLQKHGQYSDLTSITSTNTFLYFLFKLLLLIPEVAQENVYNLFDTEPNAFLAF